LRQNDTNKWLRSQWHNSNSEFTTISFIFEPAVSFKL
jgi:hypothetical protein